MQEGNFQQSSARRHPGGLRALSIALAAATIFSAAPVVAQASKAKPVVGMEEFEGKLADGTPYVLRKPANWNGIILRDLDGERSKDSGNYQLLYKAGYGLAGVSRRSGDRAWTLNRLHDMQRPQEAVELFRAKFGKPRFVLAFGQSAGGSSTMLTSERHPDTVDGGVALCATVDIVGYSGYNAIFDLFYVLKNLLAPHNDRLLTHALPTGDPDAYVKEWRTVVTEAAKTPEGRARMALALTLTHFPVYGPAKEKRALVKPDSRNPEAVADASVESVLNLAWRIGLLTVHSAADFPPDLAIPGTPVPNPVGNDGAVYADYWAKADPALKPAIEAIYARAGLNLAADLRTIDGAPRVNLDRDNMRRGILARGLPTMPLLRMDNLGDRTAPWHISKLYDNLVAFNGLGDLYRTTYVDNSGHCAFKPQQVLAAVEVMRERLETGKWPATNAAAMNARSRIDAGDGVVFVDPAPGAQAVTWRLAHSDLFQPATYAKTAALIKGYRYSVSDAQREQLLAGLSAAERASAAAEANAALDRFAVTANGISNRIVRTRLLAAVHQLRRRN